MNGEDVYEVLEGKEILQLHHANSVTTSCTFLRDGALLSRRYVERKGLRQTPQDSDSKDKEVGVWNDIFLDTVDIHARAGRQNFYGPVLFVIEARILTELPDGADVLVTRANPIYWTHGQSADERYFLSPKELRSELQNGDFGQMVTIRTRDGVLPFDSSLSRLVLDDPKLTRRGGSDFFASSESELRGAAKQAGIEVTIAKRECAPNCKCIQGYHGNSARKDFF